MFSRVLRLLTKSEKKRLILLTPWLVGSALVEVVGLAAVIPFLAILANPDSIGTVPIIGEWVAGQGIEDPLTLLRLAGVGVAAAVILANTMVVATNWRLLRFAWELNHQISSRLLQHYLAQPYSFVLRRNSAELANRVTLEVTRITRDGVTALLEVVAKSVVTIAIVTFLVLLDPLLALIAFVSLAGIYGIIFLATRRFLRRIGREVTKLNGVRLRVTSEAMGGFKEVKVAGTEAASLSRFSVPSRRYAEVQAISGAMQTLPRFALEAVAVGGMVLIASLLAGRSKAFSDTLPLMGAYAFAGLRLMPALQAIFSSVTRMRVAMGAIEAVEEDLREAVEIGSEITSTPVKPMEFADQISLHSVSFVYPGSSRAALSDVQLTIPKRQSVALVGHTGSGKTTLADVVLGLLPPTSGHVEVDGVPVTLDNLRSYRRLFGYVAQDIFLTDGTILQNVAFGIPMDQIDNNAVQQACEAAQIASFIQEELPDSYETMVGERGIRLSGGQRQRIGIARALYHDPQILVFDEATSALDIHTEQAVYNALDAIAKTRTLLTIAHRLETVATADRVVMLKDGHIVDQGPAAMILENYRLAGMNE